MAHSAIRVSDPTGQFSFIAGQGEGAMALGAIDGFGLSNDYNSQGGGLNPLLGLASGGAFANVEVAVTPRTTLSFGRTENRLVH